MPNSLVKYASTVKSVNGKRVFWDRINQDGVPFRGAFAPMMTEDEYEVRAVRVGDYRTGFFDVRDTEQTKLFQDVMECCINGWFQMMYIERFWNQTNCHYVEWVEYYMEDGSRTPYVSQGFTEVGGGQKPFATQVPQTG